MNLPDHLLRKIFSGESPVKVWRMHRKLTENELASRAGMSPARLKRIESKAVATEEEVASLATALEVHPCELQRFDGHFRGCDEALGDMD